jgi:enamine deaminase RidA (YjgF/YER057c/UK114 family)
MGKIEARLQELGHALPEPMNTGGLPFQLVKTYGDRAYVAGHVPIGADGTMARPLGKVGADVTPEQAQEAAQRCGLAILASLRQALGDLDRIEHWLRVFGMVNVAPGFNAIPQVINGCSNLIVEVFGEDVGSHTRSAVGMAELPFGVPVEIEAELAIKP